MRFDEEGRAARERAFRLIITHWADFDTHWAELQRVLESDTDELRATVNGLSEIGATLIMLLQGEWEDQGTPYDRLEVIDLVESAINRQRPA
jgi:hypothetical protein